MSALVTSDAPEFVLRTAAIGVGATAVLDLWSLFAERFLGLKARRWWTVGRWVGHFPKGRFVQDDINAAAPVQGERALGWTVHYVVGLTYAAALIAIMGLDWARQPSPAPAIVFGLVTIVAPFFVMGPGMGMGIAASKAPKPNAARLHSLIAHTVFGIGLYLAALASAALIAR